MSSKFFTVGWNYVRTSKSEHCSQACTFASQILLADKLQNCYDRVKLKKDSLKRSSHVKSLQGHQDS